jgi:hypothetical protein
MVRADKSITCFSCTSPFHSNQEGDPSVKFLQYSFMASNFVIPSNSFQEFLVSTMPGNINGHRNAKLPFIQTFNLIERWLSGITISLMRLRKYIRLKKNKEIRLWLA